MRFAEKTIRFISRSRAAAGVAVLLACSAFLCAACSHAVNSRGGELSGGGGGSSSSAGASRGSVRGGAASGGSTGGTAPDIVIGSGGGSYTVAAAGRTDYYTDVLGTAAPDASSTELGYLVLSPLSPQPPARLYQDFDSGKNVVWRDYTVTISVDGATALTHTFNAGETEACVLENVPVGASVQASATITVDADDSSGIPGYSSLIAAPVTQVMASGSNNIMLWVSYPISCVMDSGLPSDAPSYTSTVTSYTSAAATALTAPPASFTSTVDGHTYTFRGWSKVDSTTAGVDPTAADFIKLSGTTLPANGNFKGKVVLYAQYTPDDPLVDVVYNLSLPAAANPASSKFKLLATAGDDTSAITGTTKQVYASDFATTNHLVPSISGYVNSSSTPTAAYVFKGWSYSATAPQTLDFDCSSAAALMDDDMLVNRDTDGKVQLYAVWQAPSTDAEILAAWKDVSYSTSDYSKFTEFKVCTKEQLASLIDVSKNNSIASSVAGSNPSGSSSSGQGFAGKTITLLDNINMGSMTCSVDGGSYRRINFYGTFDGNGKTLTANITGGSNTGLFYCLGDNGVIKNLTLEGSVSGTGNCTGGLVGNANGTGSSIQNCTVNASVTGSGKVGGLVGLNYAATITGCTVTGTVAYNGPTVQGYIGGLVGDDNTSGTTSGNTFSGCVDARQLLMTGSKYGYICGDGPGYSSNTWTGATFQLPPSTSLSIVLENTTP